MAALWEMMPFRKKPKMLEENVDYQFVDFEDSEITGIRLLMKEYLDVVYHYNKVRVKEEVGIDMARLEFGYTLVNLGEQTQEALQDDENFHTILGDILTHILLTQQNEQTRTDNPQEPDLQ
jgi:hypothetical protein